MYEAVIVVKLRILNGFFCSAQSLICIVEHTESVLCLLEFRLGAADCRICGDVAGLVDETTLSQLATIRYKHNARGQVVIESKDDAKKRGVKSPDRAEAIMRCFANRTPGIMEFYRDQLEGRQAEAVAADVARATGNPAPEPLDEDNDLIAAYQKAREEFER